MKIKTVQAREILDSRGIPTIESKIELTDGTVAIGAVPSGASTGSTEVLEMRDGDPERYFGKGTLKAVDIVNGEIAGAIVGKEFASQEEFDKTLIELDGTPLKARLGGNSILSVSMAFCRATAKSKKLELYEYFGEMYWGENVAPQKYDMPQPMILILEGGVHGNWATDFQEYMVVPLKERFPVYSEALRAGAEIFKATHDLLVKKGYSGTVGFEGAFAPIQIRSNLEAFEILMEGTRIAGYKPGEEIVFAIDIASSEFYDIETKSYNLRREGAQLSSEEWLDVQAKWYNQFPLWSIEDPMHEEDWDGWQDFMTRFGEDHQVVGDDLLTTNVDRIKKGIELNACNSVLIKLNQIGTVTETLSAIKLSEEAGFASIISHRGGETNDDMVSDLVVGTAAWQSKFGGPDRGERLAKYNRLLEIERRLNEQR
jgi:enolase